MKTPLDPVRRCLDVDQWPEVDQDLWYRVTAPRHVLDDQGGRSSTWRAPTRLKNRQGYGRWLSYLIVNEGLDAGSPLTVHPADRITPDLVKGYVVMLQSQIASWTVWSYVTCLHQVAKAFAPEENWDWLYKIAAKLKVLRKATKEKLSKLRPASEIAAWAYKTLDELNSSSDRRPRAVLRFRDALFVAVLINCPMRLRNLTMIRIGHHLRWTGEAYALDFVPSEVKTDRYLTYHLPTKLTGYIDDWINEWRPILLRDQELDALWIGIRGAPMKAHGIYLRVRFTTEAAFGVAINPHLFRDIAVTSVADEIPENIGITGPMLGHINPKTTEDHYLHASQLIAGRRYASSVAALRQEFAKGERSTIPTGER